MMGRGGSHFNFHFHARSRSDGKRDRRFRGSGYDLELMGLRGGTS